MRQALVGLCLAAAVAIPAAAEEASSAVKPLHHHHFYHHVTRHREATIPPSATAQVVLPPVEVLPPRSLIPHIAPFANGQGDEDGLTRDENECNAGCIDGPY